MPQSVRNWSLLFAALTLAMAPVTPSKSQVIVGSFLSTNSSGFHPPSHRQLYKPEGIKKHLSMIHKKAKQQKSLFSWEDIQEFHLSHLKNWEKWYAMYRLRH